ncbi:MAG: cardiolipin synthase B [Acidobacteria bacterium]|nr:cardiolipin synthase B [Acidobacteriota bacterium]
MSPLHWFGWLALLFLLYIFYRSLFIPTLSYRVRAPFDLANPNTTHALAALADGSLHGGNCMEVFTDGPSFYAAELETISQARKSVTFEAYIFTYGEIGKEFLQLFEEKAREGVKIKLLVDAAGSLGLAFQRRALARLRALGCEIGFYHPLHVNCIERINVRTHREIIVVDGVVAFIGGAGVADPWLKSKRDRPWRDMMIRVRGPAVAALQGAFAENWLECAGEVLSGQAFFPRLQEAGTQQAVVMNSSSRGRSTHARILYQLLLASARESIWIATPYFLPDFYIRGELVRARQRGVEVNVITTGRKTDHITTRRASRRLYGELLKEGIHIYEYQPVMYHVKTLLVDRLWAVVGTTNFDHRSFSINDEINVAVPGGALNQRLEEDLKKDLEESLLLSYEDWTRRPFYERMHEELIRILERQQ